MLRTRAARLLLRSEENGERLPGLSLAVAELNEIPGRVALAPSPVLIEGESGTGKACWRG